MRASKQSNQENDSNVANNGLEESETLFDAVIIGAGWAGLAAANLLAKRGVENIRILEAKGHIGGRAYTETHPWDGEEVQIDMGAMWLHGASKNILNKLALKYNVKTPLSTYDTIIYNHNGTSYDHDEVEEYREQLFEEGFFSVQAHRQETTDYDEPLQKSADMFLDQLGTQEEEKKLTKFFLRSGIEMEYSGLLKDHSLWWWNDDYDLGGSIDTDDYFVPQGHSSLSLPFASWLQENHKIQLNAPVTCIDYRDKNDIHVHYSAGKNESPVICRAKKVIVTVPLGVLKAERISFLPKLPRRTQKSIRRLGMGKMNKVFMFWSKEDVFWPHDTEVLGDIEERDSNFVFMNPRQHNGDLPLLFAFFQGSLADAAEEAFADIDPEEYETRIRDFAMESLRSMFGDEIPMPKKVVVTKWNVDEYTMGAYSFNKVKMGKLDRYFLSQPIGKDQVFFAGEATHERYFATTAGAFMTGRTAARKVLKSLKQQVETPVS
ncbi:unnamed protein product [Cylindrotheca closterium]|uniref:Amine oxidase n=1 Tax=Cylindrotheca closterium TaxID=2856 RepID=A0AAD2CFL7_9STRA|nr:unnamed protein product [Cylindrotheca closterium]